MVDFKNIEKEIKNIDNMDIKNIDNDINQYKMKSYIGIIIYTLGIMLLCLFFYKIANSLVGFIGIIMLLVGWFIFSKNHTEITKIKLRMIAKEIFK